MSDGRSGRGVETMRNSMRCSDLRAWVLHPAARARHWAMTVDLKLVSAAPSPYQARGERDGDTIDRHSQDIGHGSRAEFRASSRMAEDARQLPEPARRGGALP